MKFQFVIILIFIYIQPQRLKRITKKKAAIWPPFLFSIRVMPFYVPNRLGVQIYLWLCDLSSHGAHSNSLTSLALSMAQPFKVREHMCS